MAIKLPVVDIPIDSSKFERFSELFQKYQAQLATTPGIWQKVNKEFRDTTAAVLAQNQAMRETLSAEREQVRNLTVAQRLWTGISGTARGVAGSMLSATASLLKWTGVFAGVGAIFSPFALGHMASDVSDQRRQAMGYGTSIGAMKAFSTNFGRVVSPGSFLGGITEMRTNPEMQGALAALGISPRGSTIDVAMQVMNALRQQALMTPTDQLGLILKKYPISGVSVEDLMRMKGTGNAEWAAQQTHFRRDQTSLNIDPKTALAWQNFTTQMERAGQTIFKTFVVGLAPLAKPLENLSASFVNLIAVVMRKDGIVEQGINTLAGWIDDFSKKTSKSTFLDDVKKFTENTHQLTQDFSSVTGQFHEWAIRIGAVSDVVTHPGHDVAVAADYYASGALRWFHEGMRWLGKIGGMGILNNNPGNLRFAHQPGAMQRNDYAAFATPQAGLQALGRQLELYYGRGLNTIPSIISKYAPPNENDTAGYIAAVEARMGASDSTTLNLKNASTLTALMNAIIRQENGKNPYGAAVGKAASVVIQNATGGSAVVAVNGLAQ